MNKFFILATIAFFILLISETDAFLFGALGGGGGGGGGGCGCAPPPPPACGCGRKKREILEPQIKTKESDPCPQKEWKKIMIQNLSGDSTNATFSIQDALYKTYNAKFFVFCNEKTKSNDAVFAANGEGYCSHGNEKIWCEALALFG